jgi:hypothetical protein
MAKQVNEDQKAKLGYEVEVHNLDKHAAADDTYIAVYHAEADGTVVPCLFTKEAIEEAKKRANKNVEDIPIYRRGLLKTLFFMK